MQQNIFRIFEVRDGIIYQIAFIASIQSTFDYLRSCNKHNSDPKTFYFANKIKIEK